jgi:hypothetical protein
MKRTICLLSIMFVFTLMIGISSYAALSDGLVAYYSFNAGTAKDGSGKGNNGTILGAAKAAAGKIGQGMDFDGKTSGIDIADNASLQLPTALTVTAWVYARTLADHGGICWKGNMIGWGNNFNWRIASTTTGLTWGTTGTAEDYFETANAMKAKEWTFVALTASGTTATGRVSTGGAFTIPVSGQNNPKTCSTPFNVWKGQPVRIGYSAGYNGALTDANKRFFDGIIDEVTIYNRALTEAELTELMTKGISTTAVDSMNKTTSTWSWIKTQ